MKKNTKLFATTLFSIILTFFAGSVWAQVCTGDYVIDNVDTSGDIATLSGCTEISGNLSVTNTSLTSLAGLENLTTVGGGLYIYGNASLPSLYGLNNITNVGDYLNIRSNAVLTSLSGLENLNSVGGFLHIYQSNALTSLSGLEGLTSVGRSVDIWSNNNLTSLNGLENLTSAHQYLWIRNNHSLTNLCALYNMHLAGYELKIYENTLLSMDTALALKTQLRSNGFTGTADIYDNNGTVRVFCDNDEDTVYDDTDNCPNICNSDQLDADGDNIGDVCDETPGCGGCGGPACEES